MKVKEVYQNTLATWTMVSACIIADGMFSLKKSPQNISNCCNTLVVLLGVFTESWFNYIQYLFAESKKDVKQRDEVMCWKKHEIFNKLIELPDEQWEKRLLNVPIKGESHHENFYSDNSCGLDKKYGERIESKIHEKKRKSSSEYAPEDWDEMWKKICKINIFLN